MIIIREETSQDIERIREINDSAFNQPNEGRIVDKIRESCTETLSMVAVLDEKVVGHIFFSPVEIETLSGKIKGMGLAPMAVAPTTKTRASVQN